VDQLAPVVVSTVGESAGNFVPKEEKKKK